eukprot:1182368-Prorocentrum_minimum.AAC.4
MTKIDNPKLNGIRALQLLERGQAPHPAVAHVHHSKVQVGQVGELGECGQDAVGHPIDHAQGQIEGRQMGENGQRIHGAHRARIVAFTAEGEVKSREAGF